MKYIVVKTWLLVIFLFPVIAQAQDVQTYTVKPGDTLYSIAREYNISVQELNRLNRLESGVIRSGMVLVLSDVVISPDSLRAPDSSASSPDAVLRADGESVVETHTLTSIATRLGLEPNVLIQLNPDIERVVERMNLISPDVEKVTKTYTVKAGDTLFGVAKSHSLTVDQLVALNSLSATSIRTGQKLQVPGEQPAGSSTWASNGILGAVMYPPTLSDRMLMSGLRYKEDIFVVGHPTLPVGTLIMLGRELEGPTVLCIVADESLSIDSHVLDVSAAVASAVRLIENERVEVYTLK